MISSGKECLTAFSNHFKSTICFNICKSPNFHFTEKGIIKLETNTSKILHLDLKGYPPNFIKYESNHPDIIKVDINGKISAIRPGSSIIKASGLDDNFDQIKVFSISNNGLINNCTLNKLNLSNYNNVMIVAHPDDETLWGGANLMKEKYFVVCLTNGYDKVRSNDFRNILNFTQNEGIILNYPDLEDSIMNDWTEVRNGIINDLSVIITYKNWAKIVTHGPEGTTGHYHHKKTSKFVKLSKNIIKMIGLFNMIRIFFKNVI